jgi:hypothetical protein
MSAPELLNLAQSPYSPYSKVIGAVTGRNDCMNKLQKHIDENRRVRPEGAPEYDKLAIGLFAGIWGVGGLGFYWIVDHFDDFLNQHILGEPSHDHHTDEL